MQFRTASPSHIHGPDTVTAVMGQVLVALLPGIAAYVYYFGWGLPINIVIASSSALAAEALVLRWRGRPLRPHLMDGSAVVTAVLLALALPPLSPWWLTAIGAMFAMVFGKHLYGGLGHNPFNPAMLGYVVLLISFPREMTAWLPPEMLNPHPLGPLQTLSAILTGHLPAGLTLDSLTMATPLDTVRTQLGLEKTLSEIHASPLFGDFGGKGWEWLGNWFFLGGVWLAMRKVITWQVPTAMLGTLLVVSGVFFLMDPDTHPSPLFHIFSGAAILGAFFIATDPVSGSSTPRGQLFFGAGVGLLTYFIRTWGGYPDGVAFAVLLMNMAAPTIDRYTQPRVFGHSPP
jgi:H+/Na+-translocating ferredoxin:NAD+ oxidoreductase subunit D